MISFAGGEGGASEAGFLSRVGTVAWVSRDASGFLFLFFSFSFQQIIYVREENILASLITLVLIKD